jgi:hypothetical protein
MARSSWWPAMPNATDFDPPEPPAAQPCGGTRPRGIAELAQLMEQGWQIEAPVLARLAWTERSPGELAYHIILARAAQRSLIVVTPTPEILHFLRERDIPIV